MGCKSGKQTPAAPEQRSRLPSKTTLLAAAPQGKEQVKPHAGTETAAACSETRLEGVCKAFHEHLDLKAVGKDILIQLLSPEEAKCKALQLPNCKGFTFKGGPTQHRVTVYFKSDWETMSRDTLAVSGCSSIDWTSYNITEEPCTAGDSVKAIFPPNGKRYGATVASIAPDKSITVNWLDGGKTHRVLESSTVTKDHKVRPSGQRQIQPVDAFISLSSSTLDTATAEIANVAHSGNREAEDVDVRALPADEPGEAPPVVASAPRSRDVPRLLQGTAIPGGQAYPTLVSVEGTSSEVISAPKRKERSFCCC